MKETKPEYEKTLAQLCLSSSGKYKNHTAFTMISDGKIVRRINYKQAGERSLQIASLLRQFGVKNGDRVLLLSENSPEWALAYFGIALAGCVSVPMLTGFSAEQIQNIINHSNVSAICLSCTMMEKFEQISNLPFIFIDSMTEENDSVTGITVLAEGQKKHVDMPSVGECKDYSIDDPNGLATIIYTSGTQGNSKGVMLSGKNIIASAISSLSFVKLYPRDRLLSVLPLAHSYECGLGLIAPVVSGSSVTYLDRPPSSSVLLPAVKLLRPTIIISVPLLIEKVYNNSIAPKLRENKLYKFPLTRPLAIRVAGRKLMSALGGKIRFFGIGGAPLSQEVEKFLSCAKFPYAIGYGLTEAAPLVAGNTPLRFRFNSGLAATDGVTIRIAKCQISTEYGVGEIQVHGPNVMLGYYRDETLTNETITSDGWLRTGDLGSLEKRGRLHIKGRLKAMILGPSGENIYPEEIEGLLGTSALVEDALVYSGSKGELVALVRLTEAAKTAAENILDELLTWVNKKLADFSRLSRIELRSEPFEKTPTMKIKRYLYV